MTTNNDLFQKKTAHRRLRKHRFLWQFFGIDHRENFKNTVTQSVPAICRIQPFSFFNNSGQGRASKVSFLFFGYIQKPSFVVLLESSKWFLIRRLHLRAKDGRDLFNMWRQLTTIRNHLAHRRLPKLAISLSKENWKGQKMSSLEGPIRNGFVANTCKYDTRVNGVSHTGNNSWL